MKDISILIVDDEKDILKSLARILDGEGYQCYIAENSRYALDILNNNHIEIVLTDLVMPGEDGLWLLKEIRRQFPYIQVLMLTAYGTIDSSVEAIKNGAFGYLLKPFNIEEVLNEVDKVTRLICLERENRLYRQKEDDEHHLFESRNTAMKQMLNLISEKLAKAESTILIYGESGTGKEVFASYIHHLSGRSKGPFVKVSCAALSEGVLESELFGHVKGSFTGAIKDKIGRFEAANGGTIFLDEIGDFSPTIQLKLLRVLQERTIERVGENQTTKVNTRIIAATNKNLEDLVKEKKFREDLFYRINVINIELPPLRNRKEDIPILVNSFIRKYAVKNKITIQNITDEAMSSIMKYDWPGNIRELENEIERAVIMSDKGLITAANLSDRLYHEAANSVTEQVSLKDAKAGFEKSFILDILLRNKKNITRTAKELGITRKNLHEKINKLNIKV